ncbi:DUF397 domain-containing protein [Streptomyces flavofungini]|uniref:DUF397 domain-containing protein n=1 Tax=Streptomyces flavofungini TaxID=68200 RepID=A0ABS0X0U7_9ACTN|nr:DUF397 domain-containing protein [Streptomyces flavofungini]MBJ3806704.1 DUF397 domain-containing protein [Streptomyces flavofungini]GHC61092.1 toxin [Streptomyces flavofungini]
MTPNTQAAATGPALKWIKSSYSGNDDADCVEVALQWRKSSYSSNDGPECVEVAIAPTCATVHIRDSKNTAAAHLTVADSAWSDFVGFAMTH